MPCPLQDNGAPADNLMRKTGCNSKGSDTGACELAHGAYRAWSRDDARMMMAIVDLDLYKQARTDNSHRALAVPCDASAAVALHSTQRRADGLLRQGDVQECQ